MFTVPDTDPAHVTAVIGMLRQLHIPNHRLGYSQLIVAIARYAQGDMLSLSKELYPYVAKSCGCCDWRAVEHSIRTAIADAWAPEDPAGWSLYFPQAQKVPSNKKLIATLAEHLQQKPLPHGRGNDYQEDSGAGLPAPGPNNDYSFSGSV